MIKFFRKIRQRLLSENRFRKYLVYAIGEIVLVVIGILIALQINNNNEAKNNEARFVKILKEIRLDLENDITSSENVIKRGIEMDSILELVLKNKLTKEDYLKNSSISLFFAGLQFSPFDYQKTAFKKFENFQGIIPVKFEPLIKDINNYYNGIGNLHDDLYSSLRLQIKERHDYLAQNFDWYHLMRQGKYTVEMVSFYTDNPIYKNWAVQHRSDNTAGKHGSVVMLQNGGFSLLLNINKVLKDNYDIKEKSFTQKFGKPLNPTDTLVAGTYKTQGGIETFYWKNRSGYLFYNDYAYLQKIDTDTYQSILSDSWVYKIQRDSNNTVVGVKSIFSKDTTRNEYAIKIE